MNTFENDEPDYGSDGLGMGNDWDETMLLRKLPMWGKKVKEEHIDFEWPLPDEFARMDPDVRITSIEFKTDCNTCPHLSSI